MKLEIDIDEDFIEQYGKQIAMSWIENLEEPVDALADIEDALNNNKFGLFSDTAEFFVLMETTEVDSDGAYSEEEVTRQKENLKKMRELREYRIAAWWVEPRVHTEEGE